MAWLLAVRCWLLDLLTVPGRFYLFYFIFILICVPFTILLPPMLIKLVPSPASARLTNSAVSDKSKTGEATCQR